MGRQENNIVVKDLNDESINQEAMAGAMVAMREQVTEQREQEDMQLAQAAQAVGGALMARMHKHFSNAAEVSMFMQVRDLPLSVLRRIPLPEIAATAAISGDSSQGVAEKTAATAANLEDFCRRVFGRSSAVLREEAQNFNLLGEQSYESAARLGLNRNALRATRALPPAKLEVVRAAIADGASKAEVLSVIEDLAEKVWQAEAAVAEAKEEIKAGESLLESKNKQIDRLQRDVKRIQTLPPDEALALLKKEAAAMAADASGAVLGGLRQALLAVDGHGHERGQYNVFLAGLVGQVQQQLVQLRDEFNLPDVSSAHAQTLAAEMAEWDQE